MSNVQKLKKERQEALASGCVIRKGRTEIVGPAGLAELVAKGKALTDGIKEMKADLDKVTAQLLQLVAPEIDGVTVLHVVAGEDKAVVTMRDKVEIEDLDGLRVVLGDRFEDLVKRKVAYEPEAKLVLMASGEGCEAAMAEKIGQCLAVREAKPGVSYKAA